MRKGSAIGRVLGSGAETMARVYGVTRCPTVKGQAMPAYDPRAVKGMGVTYATSTMGADHTSGLTTLKTIELVVKEFGVNITMGASNISFGLPDRRFVNSTYIAMAIHAGLTCPITNPLVPEVAVAVLGADLSMGRDEYGMNWIKDFRRRKKEAGPDSA